MAVKNYGKPKKSENPLANVEPDNYEASIISVEEAENQGGPLLPQRGWQRGPSHHPTPAPHPPPRARWLGGVPLGEHPSGPGGGREALLPLQHLEDHVGPRVRHGHGRQREHETPRSIPTTGSTSPSGSPINDKVIQAGVNEGKIRRDIVDYLKAKPGQKAPPPPDEGFD